MIMMSKPTATMTPHYTGDDDNILASSALYNAGDDNTAINDACDDDAFKKKTTTDDIALNDATLYGDDFNDASLDDT